MENIEETQTDPQTPLRVTEEMRSHIYEMAKWTNFLAIVGFVFSGFITITAFTVGAAIGTSPEISAMVGSLNGLGSVGFTVICLILAFALFYPSLLMYKYASKAKLGVLYAEQASLDEAFSKLKSLFKYWGIIAIIYITLYVVMLILSIMAQINIK